MPALVITLRLRHCSVGISIHSQDIPR